MRSARPDGTPLQLQTTTLAIDIAERRAETRDPVTMAFGGNRLWAKGLSADMKVGSLRLRSPVHGEIEQR